MKKQAQSWVWPLIGSQLVFGASRDQSSPSFWEAEWIQEADEGSRDCFSLGRLDSQTAQGSEVVPLRGILCGASMGLGVRQHWEDLVSIRGTYS